MKKTRNIFLFILALFISITITGCGKNGGGLFNKPLKTNDLSIDDFKYETSLKKYSGYDCYALSLTNNSKYDIIGIQFSYKVKDNVNEKQLNIFDNFIKSHSSYIEEDASSKNITLIGNKNKMIGKGETINDVIFALGYKNTAWYDIPTTEQFELMEPNELQLGIIGKDKKLYVAYYNFTNKSWTLDEKTVNVDFWPKTELAKKIESPTSKHNVIITDEGNEFKFTSYGITKDDYKKYIEKIKSLGFIDDSPTSTHYYGQSTDGYNIDITYNEDDLILEVALNRE